METQNVMLALPKDLLRRAKVVAAQRNMSLSKLLVRALEDSIDNDDTYERAHQEYLALIERGFKMGTNGASDWTRDELHERT